ncbi:MAG: nucleotidyltransferase domain-containing protein [candidate division KSB1 bacterium]|nr:nucleotidyltransferase domain-containing protein [candidate division KSB1 bacterium]
MKNNFQLTESQKNDLTTLLSGYPVIVAYLYGSVVRGDTIPTSDVDIGILLENGLTKSERFDLRLRLIGELGAVLKTSNVDLVVLNDSPIPLQFEIISANQVLYCKDESTRVDHEVYVMSRYLDMKYYRDRHSKILMEQIARDGLQ